MTNPNINSAINTKINPRTNPKINPIDLTDKRILVTGASSGIGKETAALINKLGANVIMVARNEENLKHVCEQLNGEHNNYYAYDLRNIAGIEELMKTIVAENGALDGLVHSAGIADMRPLQNTSYEFLHDMMLVNFYSFVELTRVFAKKKNNRGGSIVVISSVASEIGRKTKVAYCSSKAAVGGAVRAMAAELTAKNIRVNSIMGGFVKTDMYAKYIDTVGSISAEDDVFNNQPLGLGEPADIANAVAFLLSDAAKFITGTGMVVDGGYLSIK